MSVSKLLSQLSGAPTRILQVHYYKVCQTIEQNGVFLVFWFTGKLFPRVIFRGQAIIHNLHRKPQAGDLHVAIVEKSAVRSNSENLK